MAAGAKLRISFHVMGNGFREYENSLSKLYHEKYPHSKSDFAKKHLDSGWLFLLAFHYHEPIGFYRFRIFQHNKRKIVEAVEAFTLPKFERKGVATRLRIKLLGLARREGIEIIVARDQSVEMKAMNDRMKNRQLKNPALKNAVRIRSSEGNDFSKLAAHFKNFPATIAGPIYNTVFRIRKKRKK